MLRFLFGAERIFAQLLFGFQKEAAARPPADTKAKMEKVSDFSLESVLDAKESKPKTAAVSGRTHLNV